MEDRSYIALEMLYFSIFDLLEHLNRSAARLAEDRRQLNQNSSKQGEQMRSVSHLHTITRPNTTKREAILA